MKMYMLDFRIFVEGLHVFSKPRSDFGELFVCSRFWESIVYSTFSVSLLRHVLTLDPPLPRTKYK